MLVNLLQLNVDEFASINKGTSKRAKNSCLKNQYGLSFIFKKKLFKSKLEYTIIIHSFPAELRNLPKRFKSVMLFIFHT